MPFTIVRQDITRMQVDAIVNAANPALRMGGGVCGAIFHAAGAEELQRACDRVGPIQTGEAAITPGFKLPAKYVIHGAGPVYARYSPDRSRELLYSVYHQALILARDFQCESIAFPLISSGIFGYPKREALQVATQAIRDFLDDYDMDVYLAVFDRAALTAGEALLGSVQSYIDEHYVQAHSDRRRRNFTLRGSMASCKEPSSLEDMLSSLDESFGDALARLIAQKGIKESEVYKRGNVSRQTFSKIRNGITHPHKETVLALAISLKLDLYETEKLLRKAGYALSHNSKFDVIVEFFIINGRYDIYEINETLFDYDEKTLC